MTFISLDFSYVEFGGLSSKLRVAATTPAAKWWFAASSWSVVFRVLSTPANASCSDVFRARQFWTMRPSSPTMRLPQTAGRTMLVKLNQNYPAR